MRKDYTNGEITVEWDSSLCIHSKNCFKGLKAVFNPQQRPWVNMEAGSSEEIMKTIDKCPSGALSYYNNSEGKQEKRVEPTKKGSVVAGNSPSQVILEEGKSYLWCACGKSVDQPFCDMTHKRESDLMPMVIKPEKSGDAWLCMCKQTKNPPYCDGTHNSI